jgi:hypothetical protein
MSPPRTPAGRVSKKTGRVGSKKGTPLAHPASVEVDEDQDEVEIVSSPNLKSSTRAKKTTAVRKNPVPPVPSFATQDTDLNILPEHKYDADMASLVESPIEEDYLEAV